jgi:hypothetical protein
MRWEGQQVLGEGIGAAEALPGMRGLLRTVRTPEFAGTVFHEVEAKSVLNRVPGTSPMPFRWTVNPYRGCSHACVYCLAGHTRVLLPDGRTRPIAEMRVGDAVVGTEVVAGRRRYVRTTVLAHWSTTRPAHVVRLAGGTELVTSGEHRFLSERGWRHVAPGWCRSGRRPHLRRGSTLLGPGLPPTGAGGRRAQSPAYRQGYLCGLVRGDTAVDRVFPSAHLELEALGRAHHFLSEPAVLPGLAGVGAPAVPGGEPGRIPPPVARGAIAPIAHVTRWPEHAGSDWSAGFLAGLADACGQVTEGELTLAHSDEQVVAHAGDALHRLGFRFRSEPAARGSALRLRGGAGPLLQFLQIADPAVSARRGIGGAAVQGDAGLRVESVEPLGTTLPMYDITTGTGDFVAEGVISHNCFARNSHTYLDLDAGADFDSQIIVKVNVARVLERELRSPRWERESVAMGTNTDPYQRAEGRYRLMPGIIGALARWGTPFSVLTKGTVLTRDLPLLTAAAVDVPVSLGVSVGAARPRAAVPARTRHPVTGRPARHGPAHHRRRDALWGDGGARAPAAHRLGRGARRAARPHPGRRGEPGDRARAAPAARHPGVVHGVARPGAPAARRALPAALPARIVRRPGVPARPRRAGGPAAAPPRPPQCGRYGPYARPACPRARAAHRGAADAAVGRRKPAGLSCWGGG